MGMRSSPLKIAKAKIQVRATAPVSTHASNIMNTSTKNSENPVRTLAQTWNPVGRTNRTDATISRIGK